MSLFRTTDVQKKRVHEIIKEMEKAGFDSIFLSEVAKLADYYEGAFDLLELWLSEEDQKEKDQIIQALQEEISESKLYTTPKNT